LAITPSLQLQEGGSYGGPLDTVGIDPRTCANNSQDTRGGTITPITALSPSTNPFQCDFSTWSGSNSIAAGNLYIPNPATGQFNTPGQYRDPWELGANLAITYDVSPKVKFNLTAA